MVQIKKVKEGFVGQKMIVIPPEIHNNISKNPLINNLYLTAIGFYPYANHHDRKRSAGCTQYILLYCIEGQGTITIQDSKYILNPNHFFIIPRDVPHHYHSSSTDPWSLYWIHFEGENSDLLYYRHTDGAVPSTHSLPYDEDRIELFNQIFSTIENSFDQRSLELANINLLKFLSSLIYHKETFLSFYEVDYVNKSINFMKDNLQLNFTLQDFADEQSISVSHYSDLFKKKTGFSPIQYFNQMKIHQACQYLYFTDMSIKEICYTLGFNDQYYFSRLFKKLMEIAPAQYRYHHKKRT